MARPYNDAPRAFGWMHPCVQRTAVSEGGDTVINFYEIGNNFYAVQMNNPFQTADVRNRAPSSSIGANVDQRTRTVGRLN